MASATYRQQYVFVNWSGHAFWDGASIEVRYSSYSAFDGFFVVHYIDEDNFAYYVGEQTPPDDYYDTGFQMRSFATTNFHGAFYAGQGSADVLQDINSGNLMVLSMENYQDIIFDAGGGY